MEKNLYQIMQNIRAQKSSNNTTDVRYLGTISMHENSNASKNVNITKDIIALVDILPDGSMVTKYYDENMTLIAFRGNDGELYPSQEFMYDDLSFLSELDELMEEQSVSLSALDEELERASKLLGIDKSKILSMSDVELSEEISKKGEDGISLGNDNDSALSQEEQNEQNEESLDHINSKQEIDLDNKVDNKNTLAKILGVPAGSKLLIVHSEDIQSNDNSTCFSCIIKTPDGKLESADMLEQVGGKSSDKNVHEVDREGAVTKQNVKSSFQINSPLANNAILTIRKGSMGTTKVAYGLIDPTSHKDVFAQDLETSETYPVSARVRNEFNEEKGVYNVTEKIDEIEEHEAHGERTLALEEADGRSNTGHIHGEKAAEIILADDEFVRKTNDLFTANEIAERFESIMDKNSGLDRDKLIEMTKAELELDAEHMHDHESVYK